jgi:molecular chaperone GrpE
MADEKRDQTDEFSAAAPPHPAAAGTGETSFGDAEAPGAGTATAEPEAGADGAEVQQDLDELAAKANERDEYLALAQRTQADFDNFRKRMARENAAAGERGAAKLVKELLGALDHFDLALKAAQADDAPASPGAGEVVKGFAIIRDELLAALGRAGVEAFSPQGERFDPNEHEAMVQQPAEGAEPGTVLEVYQQGYRINGTVLRPARVVVAQ